jgi:undecaprenyl-diphosphatase
VDDYVRAIVLGLIQALTEFLPISSSGHLVLAPQLLGGSTNSLTFDVGLHVGTLLATLAYFWRDWVAILTAGARDIVGHGPRIARWSAPGKLGAYIVLGTIPAVIVGGLLDDVIEANAREAWLVALMLIAFGLLLALADRLPERLSRLDSVTADSALLIGIAQAIALVPGVSRSGVTITAARWLGFDRPTAARFSFLLSIPAVLGAATLTLAEAATGDEPLLWGPMIAGAGVSAVAGAAVIHWLLRYVQTHTMRPFVWYRFALGIIVLVVSAARTL